MNGSNDGARRAMFIGRQTSDLGPRASGVRLRISGFGPQTFGFCWRPRSDVRGPKSALLSYRNLVRGQLVEDARRYVNRFLIDGAVLGDGVRKGHGNDLVAAQGGHAAELAAMDHVDRPQTIAGGQHAVEGAGRASALHMAEDNGSGFEVGATFDLAGEDGGDPAQPGMAELVLAHVDHNRGP